MKKTSLSDAIDTLAPALLVIARYEREWHSATFSGKRMIFDALWEGNGEQLDAFSQALPEQEFTLPGQLVADIAVTAADRASDGRYRLVIEALVLDEDL